MDSQHVGALGATYSRWNHVFAADAVREGTIITVPLSAVIYRTSMLDQASEPGGAGSAGDD